MGDTGYIGRVGALAVALGVGWGWPQLGQPTRRRECLPGAPKGIGRRLAVLAPGPQNRARAAVAPALG